MRLLQLKLNNFQGLKEFSFIPGGSNADIFGENATGKTTIFNALTWLLFDKAATDIKGFNPKTKGADGQDIHNLEHWVECSFRLDDGLLITLKKVMAEDWRKTRGSNTAEFVGNPKSYFIDGVPVLEKLYKERLNAICPEETAKMLTMPFYFSEAMHYTARRQILLDMCGDMSDAEIIGSAKELQDLAKLLLKPGTVDQFYTVDEFQSIVKARCSDINRELTEIPARIDEAQKAMSGVSEKDADAAKKEIYAFYDKQNYAKQLLQELQNKNASPKIKQLAAAEDELTLARTAYNQQIAEANRRQLEQTSKIRTDILNAENEKMQLSLQLGTLKANLSKNAARREELSGKYKAAQISEWSGDTVCYACGQTLPQERVEEAKAHFNVEKSNTLEKIRKEIEETCSKPIIADLNSRIADISAELDDTSLYIEEKQDALKKATAAEAPAFETTAKYNELTARIQSIKESAEDPAARPDDSTLKAQLESIEQEIKVRHDTIQEWNQAQKQRERIEELSKRQKELGTQFEDGKRGIYLCELFIKTKVAALDERINSRFKTVRFRLFVQQVNGGIKEDCEVLIPTEGGLVPYSLANNAARINAGLELIAALSKHYGVTMPVFVDNAESVTHLQDIDAQVIRLIVSEQDQQLRVEVA